jgi:hypothetical protein
MTTIKLSEWCEKSGVAYITAYRWFKANKFPVPAYQTETGTILVEDVDMPNSVTAANDAMSLFLKKTVEFSKKGASVEDFAAFVISTFQLKLQDVSDTPRYSKNRPKAEDVQKHFQQFLPDQKEVEHLKAVKTLIKEGKTAGEVVPASNLSPEIAELSEKLGHVKPFERVSPITEYPIDDFSLLLADAAQENSQVPPVEGLVSRSVDFNTTPQQINYTGSTGHSFNLGGLVSGDPSVTVSNNCYVAPAGGTASFLSATSFAGAPTFDAGFVDGGQGVFYNAAGPVAASTPPFLPTQKELESAAKVIETADADAAANTVENLLSSYAAPRKRGRKQAFKKE